MSNELRLIVPDIFLRTGLVFYEYATQTLADWWSDPAVGSLFESPSGIVVLSWNVPYLRIRAEVFNESNTGQRPGGDATFVSDSARVAKLIEEEIKKAPKIKPAQMIAGKVSPRDVLRITFIVDTDHVSLIDDVKRAPEGGVAYELPLACYLIYLNTQAKAEDNARKQYRKTISLVLQPATYAPAYKGIVAVDLGNTNTTVAAVDIDREPSAGSVMVCPELAYGVNDPKQFALSPHGNLLPSVMRIYSTVDLESPNVSDSVELMGLSSIDELRRAVEGYSFEVGQSAQPALWPPDGLLVSPKRQLTARGQNSGNSVRTRLDDHVPPKPNYDAPCDYELKMTPELPAELFICRLFQIFKSIQRTYPRRIVVTYPTSYTRFELSQVVNAVYNAWKLAERFNPHGQLSPQEVIPLAVDEATAAAFFYLARFVLEPFPKLPFYRR